MPRLPQKQPLYEGRTLEELNAAIAEKLGTSEEPIRIEDAMTAIGVLDSFVRPVVKRAFMATVREGGVNYHLTEDGKWLKGQEKWPPANIQRGKVEMPFVPVTVATNDLIDKVERLNGDLPQAVQDAAMNFASKMAERAGRKLDQTSSDVLTEEFKTAIDEIVAVRRENAVHAQYHSMVQDLIAKLPNANGIKKG